MQRKEKRKDTGSLVYEPTAHLNSLFLSTLLPFHGINHFYFFFLPLLQASGIQWWKTALRFSYSSILDQECWAIQAACRCTLLPKPSTENKRCSVLPSPGPISLWGEGGYQWTSATFVSRIYDKVKKTGHRSAFQIWSGMCWIELFARVVPSFWPVNFKTKSKLLQWVETFPRCWLGN